MGCHREVGECVGGRCRLSRPPGRDRFTKRAQEGGEGGGCGEGGRRGGGGDGMHCGKKSGVSLSSWRG